MSQQHWGRPASPQGAGRPGAPQAGAWPPPAGQAPWPQQASWPQQAPWPPPQQAWSPPARPQQAPWGAQAGWQAQAQRGGWPAPQAPWPPRQPQRRGGIGRLLGVVVAVVVVLMASTIVRGMLQPSAPTGNTYDPTGSSGVPYVNEDFVPPDADLTPPDLPGPRNLAAARSLTSSNPLYDQSVPAPTNCEMDDIDMASATVAEMEDHFDDLMVCLMRVYDGPVSDAGFTMPRPPVTVFDRPIRTPCGDFDDVNAAYCSGDQRIYYAAPLLEALGPEAAATHYAAETILAHEFGHAVQARTAILMSMYALSNQASSQDESLELSRRIEVQADCLAGLYITSIAQSQQLGRAQLDDLRRFIRSLGDDALSGNAGHSGGHGTGQARQLWFDRALGATGVGTCNTFTAPSDEVR